MRSLTQTLHLELSILVLWQLRPSCDSSNASGWILKSFCQMVWSDFTVLNSDWHTLKDKRIELLHKQPVVFMNKQNTQLRSSSYTPSIISTQLQRVKARVRRQVYRFYLDVLILDVLKQTAGWSLHHHGDRAAGTLLTTGRRWWTSNRGFFLLLSG